jgi:glycosyltransferase involved in cell wall biosynthesis
MERPFFSILIPTRNRPELAAGCVRAVLAQDHDRFEVLLLDQSDGEATREAARSAASGSPHFQYVKVAGVGRSRGLNAGIPLARGDWLVFTDDDCEPDRGWLHALEQEVLRAGPREAIVGRVRPGPVGPGMAPPPAILDRAEAADYEGRIGIDLVYPNFAAPRAAFAEIGAYDVRMGVGTPLPGGEDNDLGYRLLRAGWRILYRPGPGVTHLAWRDTRARAVLKRAYGLGQGAFYAKHMLRLDPFIAWRFASDMARTAWAAAGAALRGLGQESRGHLAFLGGLLGGAVRMGALALRGVPSEER